MQLAALLSFVPQLPFFRNDTLTLVQSTVTVDDDGIGQAWPSGRQFSGAVDPSQSDALNRMLEGQNLSGAIMVVTSQPLSAGNEGRAPDVIGWNGRRYQVRAVADYAEGSAGIRSAACTLIDINPPS